MKAAWGLHESAWRWGPRDIILRQGRQGPRPDSPPAYEHTCHEVPQLSVHPSVHPLTAAQRCQHTSYRVKATPYCHPTHDAKMNQGSWQRLAVACIENWACSWDWESWWFGKTRVQSSLSERLWLACWQFLRSQGRFWGKCRQHSGEHVELGRLKFQRAR